MKIGRGSPVTTVESSSLGIHLQETVHNSPSLSHHILAPMSPLIAFWLLCLLSSHSGSGVSSHHILALASPIIKFWPYITAPALVFWYSGPYISYLTLWLLRLLFSHTGPCVSYFHILAIVVCCGVIGELNINFDFLSNGYLSP